MDALGAELGSWLAEKFDGSESVWLSTWTFRPTPWAASPGRQYATKALKNLARWLDGPDSSAFISMEKGGDYTERLHLHSIGDRMGAIQYGESRWMSLYGSSNRSERCDSRSGVAMYVAKYVTKRTGALVAPAFDAVGPRFPVMNASS